MDLSSRECLKKENSLNSLQVIKRRFAPTDIPDFTAIAEDGPHWRVKQREKKMGTQPGAVRLKEVCHARDSQNWLLRVKSSALVTGFVLAEGTHQTRYVFGESYSI